MPETQTQAQRTVQSPEERQKAELLDFLRVPGRIALLYQSRTLRSDGDRPPSAESQQAVKQLVKILGLPDRVYDLVQTQPDDWISTRMFASLIDRETGVAFHLDYFSTFDPDRPNTESVSWGKSSSDLIENDPDVSHIRVARKLGLNPNSIDTRFLHQGKPWFAHPEADRNNFKVLDVEVRNTSGAGTPEIYRFDRVTGKFLGKVDPAHAEQPQPRQTAVLPQQSEILEFFNDKRNHLYLRDAQTLRGFQGAPPARPEGKVVVKNLAKLLGLPEKDYHLAADCLVIRGYSATFIYTLADPDTGAATRVSYMARITLRDLATPQGEGITIEKVSSTFPKFDPKLDQIWIGRSLGLDPDSIKYRLLHNGKPLLEYSKEEIAKFKVIDVEVRGKKGAPPPKVYQFDAATGKPKNR